MLLKTKFAAFILGLKQKVICIITSIEKNRFKCILVALYHFTHNEIYVFMKFTKISLCRICGTKRVLSVYNTTQKNYIFIMLYKEKLFVVYFTDAISNIKKLIINVQVYNKIFVAKYMNCIYCKFARTCSKLRVEYCIQSCVLLIIVWKYIQLWYVFWTIFLHTMWNL